MSIIGGAVTPLIQGLIADVTGSVSLSFIVNVVSFAIVGAYALNYYRRHQAANEVSHVEELS